MNVNFHVNNKNLKANLSVEQTVPCNPNPYRILTLYSEGQTVCIFLTTQQVLELMSALAEGLAKEPEKEPEPRGNLSWRLRHGMRNIAALVILFEFGWLLSDKLRSQNIPVGTACTGQSEKLSGPSLKYLPDTDPRIG